MRYLIILLLLPAFLHAQDCRVTGRLIDGETDEPLIGANVMISYRSTPGGPFHTTDAATDANGEFVIIIDETPLPRFLTLQTGYIGYSSTGFLIGVDSTSTRMELESIPLDSDWFLDSGWHCGSGFWPPMIDKFQTNSRSKIYADEIRNLPIL